ncbi:hypothetical protein AVEN_136063-1 [Araneus ventricosus]|uniref:HTH psq-type domain-containing protein n=1 Tax=Araneus ventricosus TaxID=182803 RepID=A0A4Y2P188_ARAVE|nr:hypothetical protein AVEN_136063-1 [Araneus ventricosus]
MGGVSRRRASSIEDKVEIIKRIENNENRSAVCRSFSLSKSTIGTIWRNRSEVISVCEKILNGVKNLRNYFYFLIPTEGDRVTTSVNDGISDDIIPWLNGARLEKKLWKNINRHKKYALALRFDLAGSKEIQEKRRTTEQNAVPYPRTRDQIGH